jgi:hypothetical protein
MRPAVASDSGQLVVRPASAEPQAAVASGGPEAAAAEAAASLASPATDPGAASGAEASPEAGFDEGAAAAAGTGIPAPALTIRWTYQQPLDPGAEAEVFFHVRLL